MKNNFLFKYKNTIALMTILSVLAFLGFKADIFSLQTSSSTYDISGGTFYTVSDNSVGLLVIDDNGGSYTVHFSAPDGTSNDPIVGTYDSYESAYCSGLVYAYNALAPGVSGGADAVGVNKVKTHIAQDLINNHGYSVEDFGGTSASTSTSETQTQTETNTTSETANNQESSDTAQPSNGSNQTSEVNSSTNENTDANTDASTENVNEEATNSDADTSNTSSEAEEWNEINRVEPTCTTDGYIEYENSSTGETKQEVLAALGHEEVDEIITEATLFRGGTSVKRCSRCGEVLETIPTKAKFPTWGYIVGGVVLRAGFGAATVFTIKRRKK